MHAPANPWTVAHAPWWQAHRARRLAQAINDQDEERVMQILQSSWFSRLRVDDIQLRRKYAQPGTEMTLQDVFSQDDEMPCALSFWSRLTQRDRVDVLCAVVQGLKPRCTQALLREGVSANGNERVRPAQCLEPMGTFGSHKTKVIRQAVWDTLRSQPDFNPWLNARVGYAFFKTPQGMRATFALAVLHQEREIEGQACLPAACLRDGNFAMACALLDHAIEKQLSPPEDLASQLWQASTLQMIENFAKHGFFITPFEGDILERIWVNMARLGMSGPRPYVVHDLARTWRHDSGKNLDDSRLMEAWMQWCGHWDQDPLLHQACLHWGQMHGTNHPEFAPLLSRFQADSLETHTTPVVSLPSARRL